MGQRAGVEASHRADLVAAEGEHEHPGRVGYPGLRVFDVEAERRLPGRPQGTVTAVSAWPGYRRSREMLGDAASRRGQQPTIRPGKLGCRKPR